MSGNTNTGVVITDDDVNPILQIVAWLLLATTTLLLVFRIVARFFLKSKQSFGWDDRFICCSFVFGVGVWVTWFVPENGVFGKSMSDSSPEELVVGGKVDYARDLFYIGALAFSKLSVCANILSLSPNRSHKFTVLGLGCFIITWLVSSWLATAFQCGTRGPWQSNGSGVCINKPVFFTFLNAVSIASDVFLVALPAWIIYPLHMPLKTRAVILSFYSLRALVIGVTIVEIIYLPRRFQDDYTLRAFPYSLAQQTVTFSTITSACILYFWPLLRSLESGRIWGNSTTFQSEYPLRSLKARLHSSQLSKSDDNRPYVNIPSIGGGQRSIKSIPPRSDSQASDSAMI
ncbi:hypothetical protein F4777DRAFT_462878 [Nemania sp. FL0916]|nr:hypothetical protein F4777DRAFT_462878 [Nemania sp. FL0916]